MLDPVTAERQLSAVILITNKPVHMSLEEERKLYDSTAR